MSQIITTTPQGQDEEPEQPGFLVSVAATPQTDKSAKATIVVSGEHCFVSVTRANGQPISGFLHEQELAAEIALTCKRWLDRLEAVEEIDAPEIIKEANLIISQPARKILVVKGGRIQ